MKARPLPKRIVLSLLVMLWVGLFVAWYFSPRMKSSAERATDSRTQIDLMFLSSAAQQFQQVHGRWPIHLLELGAKFQGRAFYTGPFADAWGRPYLYVAPSASAPGRVETYGADGIVGGDQRDGNAVREFSVLPQMIVRPAVMAPK